MKKIAIGIAAVTALIGTSVVVSAQSMESQSTDDILRRLQALEASNAALTKENAALRVENTKLRGRVSEQKASNEIATAQQTSTTSASTLNRTSSKAALYDKAASPMVVKVPPPLPVPVYSWTGFYVGGNIGYGWGNADTDLSTSVTVISDPITSTSPFSVSGSQRLQGVIGGGQVGLNYQFSPQWVAGFEFDFQGSGERASGTFAGPFSGSACVGGGGNPFVCQTFFPATGTVTTSQDARIDWFGTARGRIGYLITDQVLLYATGGVAYGQVKLSGLSTTSGFVIGTAHSISSTSAAFSASHANAGWAAGGGVEGKFAYWLPSNWTWKLEYLYVDLGSLDTVTPGPSPIVPFIFESSLGTVTTHTHFTDNIVRAGLNYQFH